MNTAAEKPELSLVIPAYNEGAKIGRDLKILTGYLDGRSLSYEIIVVDDGSEDSTSRVVSGFAEGRPNLTLLRNERNRGKGYSVRRGILSARGRYVAFLDAGMCVPPGEIEKPLSCLADGCDVALGSRDFQDSAMVRRRSWYRIAGSWVFARVVKRMMGLSAINDTQCGLKFFTREAAGKIFSEMRTDGFMFDIELLRRALAAKMKIVQFPVTWSNDPDTRFRLVAGSVDNMVELIRITLMKRFK